MYTRQPSDDRFYRGIRIPNEYHGNAFRNEAEEPPLSDDTPQTEITDENASATLETTNEPTEAQRTNASPLFGGLFGGGGGIGFEELLIIAIAFLVSQSSDKDDLAFLLLLLLFIK